MKKFCGKIVLFLLTVSAAAQEWNVESGNASAAYDAKNKVLKISVADGYKGKVVLRPAKEFKLAPDSLRIYADVASEKPFSAVWLITADNEREYEYPTAKIPGRIWTKTVSEYIGGERRKLTSLDPKYRHPRFKALPSSVSGLVLDTQGKNEILIAGIQSDNTEYLKERRWEFIRRTWPNPFSGLKPFGSGDVVFPLDRLLPSKKGKYEIEWTLADRYQGAPINGGSQTVDWNPADKTGIRGKSLKIVLPRGSNTFRVSVKIRDERGYLVEAIRYAVGVFRDGSYTPAKESDRFAHNPGGCFRVAMLTDDSIFPSPDAVSFRLFRKRGTPANKIRIMASDTSFTARGTGGLRREYPWNPDTRGFQTVALPGTRKGAAYKVSIALLNRDGKVIDKEEFVFGVRAPDRKAEKLKIRQPVLSEMFPKGRVNLNCCDLADFFGSAYIPANKTFEQFYRGCMERWKKCRVTTVRLSMGLEEVMPLPGFFDTRSVELRTRLLKKAGFTYNFAIPRHVDLMKPEWFPYLPEENCMGLSWVSPNSGQNPLASLPTQKLLFDHFYGLYKNDRGFMGWVLWSDLFFRDSCRAGFSPGLQSSFIRFLSEVKGVKSDVALNRRYGVKGAKLDRSLIPVPLLDCRNAYGAENERFASPAHRDLIEFKTWLLKDSLFDLLFHMRTAGETRGVGFYAIPSLSVEYYLDELLKHGVFTTIGREGSVYHDTLRNQSYPVFYRDFHFLNEYTAFTPGCEYGRYWTDMAERDCDRLLSTLMMTGGKNINFTMLYPGPDFSGLKCKGGEPFWTYSAGEKEAYFAPVRKRQEAGLSRQSKWIDAVNGGFIRSEIVPWNMAVLSHGVCGGNSGGTGIGDYLAGDYPFHLLKDYSEERGFSGQKLIWVPESPGLFNFDADFSRKMFDRLVRFVKNGGKTVILSPDAGRYTFGNAEEPFYLLRALGWNDVSPFRKTGNTGNAAVFAGSRIFRQTKQFFFKGPRPGSGIADLPPGAVVEAVFSDGQPACIRWKCGKGEVILFTARLDLRKHPKQTFVDDFTAWAGFEWPVKLSKPVFHTLTRDGGTFYLMLYSEEKTKEPVPVMVRIGQLPAEHYKLEEIGPTPYPAASVSAAELEKGIPLKIPAGMRLIRLTPQK